MEMNLVEKSHELLGKYAPRTGFAIDATLGRGRDALFMARELDAVVYGFDVQPEAVESSSSLFGKNGLTKNARFFTANHADMEKYIQTGVRIGAVVFNLGWLPSSDKKIATKKEDTIAALESALAFAALEGGVISVLSYRGHKGGTEEFVAVADFFLKNSHAFDVFEKYGDVNNEKSPILFFAKIKSPVLIA